MKAIIATIIAASAIAAQATERERIPTRPPAPVVAPASDSSSTSNASANAAPIAIGGTDHSMIALPGSAATAAPLPAGTCLVGESHAKGFVWGLFWHSDSVTRIDMECLKLVSQVNAMRAAPAPAGPAIVQLLTAAPAQPEPAKPAAACVPPAKAKSVAQAKAAGGCK